MPSPTWEGITNYERGDWRPGCHVKNTKLYEDPSTASKVTKVICNDRTIAQAVSRWLPTAAARVRARVWQVGFVVDKVALGQVFSEHFVFPLLIFIPPNSPSSSQSPGAGTIGHSVADVPSGPSLDSTTTMRIKKEKRSYARN
jgi:hypothetical protein